MNVEYHEAAQQEFCDIIDWYNGQQTGLADDFLDKYEQALGLITTNPFAWPDIGRDARRYLTDKFPYGIIYLVGEDHLRVIAIAHTSRRPGYWRSRLKH